jgi:apolipoprotein N-acyltransferase
MLMAILFNSLFMSLVFQLFHFAKKYLGNRTGYVCFIVFWIGFEWLHLNWELSWPWLTLGNFFANEPSLVQWYEYTGILGGSLWILLLNTLFFFAIKNRINKQKTSIIYFLIVISIVFIPTLSSLIIKKNYAEEQNPISVLIVQPNIDPYNDKFGGMEDKEQVHKMLQLAEEKMDSNVQFVVLPETALPNGYWEDELDSVDLILMLKNFAKKYPRVNIVAGMSSFKSYENGSNIPETAKPFTDSSGWYDAFNTAIQITNSNKIDIYHKSKLVLGVEKLPFSWLFKPIEKFALDLGGTMGSLGTQTERSVFTKTTNSNSAEITHIAPVICYESIYGEFCTEYINKGANTIFILTNDGWWEDTPGYKQHLAFARIRAIENRRSIARCANTGTSAFINQLGETFNETAWWTPAVIKNTINLNNKKTFYAIYGDVIGRIAAALSVLLLFWSISKKIIRTKGIV